ncbi:MAG TPA: ABC transporter permease [Blastocatellia bacterium]|nr:ABC transporter permease [Blastocatellia bacterium]
MPDWKKYVRDHLAPLALGAEREAQMVDEMAQHLEAVYEEALSDGLPEHEALTRTVAHIKDWRLLECELIRSKRPVAGPLINNRVAREARLQSETRKAGTTMGSFLQDLRYGIRMLARSRAFTAVAVVSLGLAIGANTAIFSLVDAVVLKTLPVRKPNELVLFSWLSGEEFMASTISGTLKKDKATGLSTSTSFSYDTFNQFRDHSQTLTDVLAFAELEQLTVKADGQATITTGQVVSGSYYSALGVSPMAGRPITEDDDQVGADPVAVISYRYWQRRFGLDPNTIGKTVDINGVSFKLIGVAPHGFEGTLQVGQSPDFTIPLAMEPRVRALSGSLMNERGAWWLRIMGRLKPAATREQTRVELERLFQQSALEGYQESLAQKARKPKGKTEERGEPSVPTLRVASGSQGLNEARAEYSLSLLILAAVVGLVLLIACANVATLLLSRATSRQKEIAVRLALGASRWRVIRQLLTESVLLAILGAALGVVLAFWGKDVLLALRPWGGEELELELKLDPRVLGFTALLSLLTALLFGIAPALRATRVELGSALKETGRSLIGGAHIGLTKGLVIVQVALSLLLLIGAGLFVRTLSNLHSVDLGFNARNLLLFRVDPRLSGYKKDQIANLYQRLLERIEAVPGVTRATLSRHPLLSGSAAIDMAFIEDKPTPAAPTSFKDMTWMQRVRANFLDTMEIPIMTGRGLQDTDDERGPRVAVINQTMARKQFGDENPIGKRFGFESPEHSRDIEIVGVARDAKYSSLRMEVPSTVYLPYLQDLQGLGQMNFEVRTSGDPAQLAGSIREAVREVDANLPLFGMYTQLQQADLSLASERLFASLSGFFGVLALLLATIGLYGVMSYGVARRTNEIGIRMALGARPPQVVSMVLRETMLLVIVGVAIGVGAAIATTRLIESMLFGLTPNDPVSILLGVLLMICVSAFAGYLPARRASRVDPLTALRHE